MSGTLHAARRLRAALLLTTAVALGGTVTSCAADASAPALPREATAELRLGLTEWSIETGGVRVLPGEVRVRVTNAGGTRHDVVVHGEQGTWESPVLDPGETHDMVIMAVAGERLDLVCTVVGHDSQGMHTHVDVVETG